MLIKDISADIVTEMETIENHISKSKGFGMIRLQSIPRSYTADEVLIRYIGDVTRSETSYHNRIEREYQIIHFGADEFSCLQGISTLQKTLGKQIKLQLKGSTRYMTLNSFSTSQPFKSEDTDVYVIIGILEVTVRDSIDQDTYDKMDGIYINTLSHSKE